MSLEEEITNEVCRTFPKETHNYKHLIYDAICRIMRNLPPGMTKEKYKEIVFEHLKVIQDGKTN